MGSVYWTLFLPSARDNALYQPGLGSAVWVFVERMLPSTEPCQPSVWISSDCEAVHQASEFCVLNMSVSPSVTACVSGAGRLLTLVWRFHS